MTIGVKTPNSVVYLLETVTNFQETYSGSLSSHPIEGGKSIADNVTSQHPVFNVSAVLSAVDFGFDFIGAGAVADLFQQSLANTDNSDAIIISKNPIQPIQISSSGVSPLTQLLPEGIAAFFDTTKLPEVSAQTTNPESTEDIKEGLLDIWQRSVPVDLLVIDQNVVQRVIKGCVITNISASVTPESGDALEVSVTFEKPQIAILKTTVIPSLTWKELRIGTDSKKGKGKQNGGADGAAASTSQPPPPPATASTADCVAAGGTHLNCWLGTFR